MFDADEITKKPRCLDAQYSSFPSLQFSRATYTTKKILAGKEEAAAYKRMCKRLRV